MLKLGFTLALALSLALGLRLYSLQRQITELQSRLVVRSVVAKPDSPVPRAAVATPSATPPDKAGTQSKPTPAQVQAEIDKWQVKDRQRMRKEMSTPQRLALARQRSWMSLDARYSELFRLLNLGPERTDRLKQLLVDRALTRMDAYAMAEDLSPAAEEELRRKVLSEVNAQIATEFGSDVASTLQSYEKDEALWNKVRAIDTRIGYLADELQPAQKSALIHVMSANPPPRIGKNATATEKQQFLEQLRECNTRTSAAAAEILSPVQQRAFARFLDDEAQLEAAQLAAASVPAT